MIDVRTSDPDPHPGFSSSGGSVCSGSGSKVHIILKAIVFLTLKINWNR